MASISPEVAAQELEKFFTAMGLDFDVDGMDEASREAFESAKADLVAAMGTGKLHINSEGQAVFTTREGKQLTFREPTGASLMAMDSVRGGDTNRLVAFMQDVTGSNPGEFAKMNLRDFKICAAVANFLAAA